MASLDATELFSAVSLFCARVIRDPEDIFDALPAAIAAAHAGGPSVILLPKDIQQSVIEIRPSNKAFDADCEPAIGRCHADCAGVRRARGPVIIIAGEQVARDDARVELEQTAIACSAPGWRPYRTPRTSVLTPTSASPA